MACHGAIAHSFITQAVAESIRTAPAQTVDLESCLPERLEPVYEVLTQCSSRTVDGDKIAATFISVVFFEAKLFRQRAGQVLTNACEEPVADAEGDIVGKAGRSAVVVCTGDLRTSA